MTNVFPITVTGWSVGAADTVEKGSGNGEYQKYYTTPVVSKSLNIHSNDMTWKMPGKVELLLYSLP